MQQRFHDHHQQLVDLALSIATLAEKGDCADDFCRARLALSRALATHCEEELAQVNALTAVARAAIPAALVTRYHDELLRWRGDLIDCNAKWPPRDALTNRDAFLKDFRPLIDRLRERVRWEETHFYPALLAAAPRRAGAGPLAGVAA